MDFAPEPKRATWKGKRTQKNALPFAPQLLGTRRGSTPRAGVAHEPRPARRRCRHRCPLQGAGEFDGPVLGVVAGDSGRQLEEQALDDWSWHGKRVVMVDGSTLSMPLRAPTRCPPAIAV